MGCGCNTPPINVPPRGATLRVKGDTPKEAFIKLLQDSIELPIEIIREQTLALTGRIPNTRAEALHFLTGGSP